MLSRRGLLVAAAMVVALAAGMLHVPADARADPAPDPGQDRSVSADRYDAVPATRVHEPGVPLLAGRTERVPVAGRAGLPRTGVSAVSVSITATSPVPGTVSVWPSGEAPPPTPTLPVTPGRTATTTAVVGVGPDGTLALGAAPGPTSVAVDVTGWFPVASTLVTGSPTRLYDSRGGTVDGRDARSGPVQAGTTMPLQVGGRAFGSSPAGSSVLLSVTSDRADGASGLTFWPSGGPQPSVPSVPVAPGSPTHDTVFTQVGRDGAVDMALAGGSADVTVDVVAVVPARSAITPVTPARVFDSRPGTVTVDGRDAAAGAAVAGTERRVVLRGRGGVPASATAVVTHLWATAADRPVEVRAWGTGDRPPGPSTAPAAGTTSSNLVVLPLAPDGSVTVRSDGGAADLAMDVEGWIGVAEEPARAADQVLWRGDIETGDLSQFKDTPWNWVGAGGPKVVGVPVRHGHSAVQFTMPGGGQRSEIEPDVPNFKEGDTLFFAQSVFLAPDFPAGTDTWQVITQWKNTGEGSPPISIKVGKGKFYFDGGASHGATMFDKDIGPAPVNQWVDLVYGITFSSDSRKARVDAWVDGKQTVTDFHPPSGTLYGGSQSYLKTGVYRDSSISQRGVLTMDDWRVATSFRAATS